MPMSPRLLRPRASGPSAVFATDSDARAYIAAVHVADGQPLELAVQQAVDNFVIGCKADGIWTAIRASCILAGARTLSGALVPLVGLSPTNNNFVAADYNRKTGLSPGGAAKWLNTNYANNSDSRQNNNHNAVFATAVQKDTFLFGDNFGGTGNTTIVANNTRNVNGSSDTTLLAGDAANANELYGSARNASDTYSALASNISYTLTRASQTPSSANIGVFRLSATASFGAINSRLMYYSIGNFLSLSQLRSRLLTLQTAINAAIP